MPAEIDCSYDTEDAEMSRFIEGERTIGAAEQMMKEQKPLGLDRVLLTIQLERRRLQADFDREMAALDRRERSFLGLKIDD
jgi:hypothetical protein